MPKRRWIKRALAVGMAMWGWTWHGPPPAVVTVKLEPNALGAADTANDEILLNRASRTTWTWQRTCQTVLHEWGHLTGRHHSKDPSSIMYPRVHRFEWRCRQGGRPYIRERRE
jgi:hypothetical protein